MISPDGYCQKQPKLNCFECISLFETVLEPGQHWTGLSGQMAGQAPGEAFVTDLIQDVTFHGVDYIVMVSVAEGPTLVVDVEQVCVLGAGSRSGVIGG